MLLSPETQKGHPKVAPMRFGPVRTRVLRPEGRRDQNEGCLVSFTTIPMPEAKTEISLDIGSPSFLFVDVTKNVGDPAPSARARRYFC